MKKLKYGGAVGVLQSPEHRGGEAAGVASRRRRETGGRSDAHSSLEIALESKRARNTGAENCSVIGAKKMKQRKSRSDLLGSGAIFWCNAHKVEIGATAEMTALN
ncbi:hypothetical protein U1Q18_029517 [Sarracenia purpurea var. burkii]